jgi:thiosulfate reductase cytochrome b subunit
MTAVADQDLAAPAPPAVEPEVIARHSLLVRLTHWTNALALLVLLLSGLQIFNAHPRLYWGKAGADADRPWIEMRAEPSASGGVRGVTVVGPLRLETTGVLGASRQQGQWQARGFPGWLTLPTYRDLSAGRAWHFFFAWVFVLNGLVYLLGGIASGHFRRDLAPSRDQLTVRHIAGQIAEHARLHRATGAAARRYNVIQKFSYLLVVFVLLPLMVLTGLTMSPAMDAAWPWLLDLFGGRQSARSIHFISASLIVLFVLVHVAEVFIAGPVNEIRSMITGRYVVPPEGRP